MVASGVDLFNTGESRRPREAPRVNVVHRRHRHIDVIAVEAALFRCEAKHGKLCHCMQNELPVAEVDALRKAGSPGGIERRRLRILVKIGKLVIRRSSRQKFLVLADKTELADGRCLAVTEDYELFDLRKPRQDRMDKFDKLPGRCKCRSN